MEPRTSEPNLLRHLPNDLQHDLVDNERACAPMRPGSVSAAPSMTRRACCCAAVSTRWRCCLASAVFSPGVFIGASQGSFVLLLWGWRMKRCSKSKRALLHALADCLQIIRGVFICS